MLKKPLQLLMWVSIFMLLLLTVYIFLQLRMIWEPVCVLLKSILIPLAIAVFITYLLLPVVEKIHRAGVPRTLSILLIYVLFFAGLGYAFYKGVPILIKQLTELSEGIPVLAASYESMLDQLHHHTDGWPDGMHDRIDRFVNQTEEFVASWVERTIRSIRFVFDYMLVAAIIPFLVFYMVKDIDTMKKAVWYLTPSSWRARGSEFIRDVDDSLGDYIRGQLFVCLVIGLGASLSFWFFDLPYPLILGLVIGATNVIPYFGPVIGAIPAVMVAAALSSRLVFVVIITILILQFIEGNILGPLVVGKSLHMHPVVIMLGLLAGGELAGIIGMILAVPVMAVIKVMLVHFLAARKA
ncbi:AI-2E family transporter [Bacillus haynesii]|nr:AI-2E family transporter [Bacillus haynesii]TWK25716.1 AI-2 transport protein TqsA [Bacillus licheniformis]MCY7801323.1 AI-2E family transporter [Bacillus haynesii]MCY7835086.1 AI-2E family transporter [Bacillus haynesii]MCY7968248.1 AI-2E family transporter [Bacillus haynesii]MCY7993208.1 AI-2E family transporter [Bacillus haynesii]